METTDAVDGAAARTAPRPKSAIRQTVVREFGDVGKYRVRLVKTSDKPGAPAVLDVREYVRGANYEGFTRKGVRLGAVEAKALRDILEGAESEGLFA